MKIHHTTDWDHMAGRLEIHREHKRREYGARLFRIGSAHGAAGRPMRIKVLEQAGAAAGDVSRYLYGDNGIPEFGARPADRYPVTEPVHNGFPDEPGRGAGDLFGEAIRAAAEAALPGQAGRRLVAGIGAGAGVASRRGVMARLGRASRAADRQPERAGVSVTGDEGCHEGWITPETRDPLHRVVREEQRDVSVRGQAASFRAALLGGTSGVLNRPGAGTSVRVLVPRAGNRDVCPV